jgi:hypothetical protein
MVIACLVLAGICLGLWRENRALRTDQSLSSETSAPIRSHLWPLLFNPQQTTQIIIADSCLGYLQDASHTEISLKDYLTRRYLNDLNSPELRLIAS